MPLAVNGDADAQNYLGVMCEKGKGVPLDYKTAVKWFERAAEQGHSDAQGRVKFLERKFAREKREPLGKRLQRALQRDPAQRGSQC